MHLWAGVPSYMRVHVRAEDLPFRAEQRGVITVTGQDGATLVNIPVRAHVSLWREGWRIIWRGLAAAGPQSWQYLRRTWQAHVAFYRRITAPFLKQPWLTWVLWFLVSTAMGILLYTFPGEAAQMPLLGPALATQGDIVRIVLRAVILPPLLVCTLWPALVVASLLGAGLCGAAVGAYRSFAR